MSRSRRPQPELLEARCLLEAVPIISEFMAANSRTLPDQDGDYSDWIEIQNPRSQPIGLEGWSLTDNPQRPRKWTFPPLVLQPGEHRIVFASDKNRRDPLGELHTNFKLDKEGEFLALVDPAGTIVQSFAPMFPPQTPDVSYGIPLRPSQILSAVDGATLLVPQAVDAALEESWFLPGFDDGSWSRASGAVGYDLRSPIANAGFEAEGLEPWEAGGHVTIESERVDVKPTQGLAHVLLTARRNSLPRYDAETFLNLRAGTLDATPNGPATRASVIKRTLTVSAGSQLALDFSFLTDEPTVGGNRDFAFVVITPGPGVIELANTSDADKLSSTQWRRETGYQSFRYTFPEAGTYTLGMGVIQQGNREYESSLLVDNLTVDGVGAEDSLYGPMLGSDLSSDLLGTNTSVWTRWSFGVGDLAPFDHVLLRVRYDGGFAAWLNGQPIAQRNAPQPTRWDSEATGSVAEGVLHEVEVLIPEASRWLRAGQNTLAVHGLTRDGHPSFFLEPELLGLEVEEATFLSVPTPGRANAVPPRQSVSQVRFSEPSGFYDLPFTLRLTTDTAAAQIRYTTDGTAPAEDYGAVYQGPLPITGTTIVRAAAFQPGFVPSSVETRTYIFRDDVLGQSNQQAIDNGYPEYWFPIAGENAPGDYAMDQRVIGQAGADQFDGRYAATVRDDLLAVPSLSLVMDPADLFGPSGIYLNPQQRGRDWEKPVSVEWIDPAGGGGFLINAGIRIQGGVSRLISQKQSLRLIFRGEYGAAKLEYPLFGSQAASSFDSLTLRSSAGEHLFGIHYLRDAFVRRSQQATGHPPPHGRFVHLYLTGMYWGLYEVVERVDEQFAANYFGGSKEEWDVLVKGDEFGVEFEVMAGTIDAWNQLLEVAGQIERATSQQEKNAIYLRLQGRREDGSREPSWPGYLDPVNFIDYLITQTYAKTTDWPQRNYYMARRRGPDSTGFKFFVWDAEYALDAGVRSSLHNLPNVGPGRLFHLLKTAEAFQVDFRDRVQQHFSPGGAFYVNPEQPYWDTTRPQDNVPAARYYQLVQEVWQAIVPETARWGDEVGTDSGPYAGQVFTRDDQWQGVVQNNLRRFFPSRSAEYLAALEPLPHAPQDFYQAGPVFSHPPGSVDWAERVQISSADEVVYYTLDGRDPRAPDGSVSAAGKVYEGPIAITGVTGIQVRGRSGDKWSAIAAAGYFPRNVLVGDLDGDGQLGLADVDLLCSASRGQVHSDRYDLNGDGQVDRSDFDTLTRQLIGTRPGDVNLDGVFDSSDLVLLFQAGQYEDAVPANSRWSTGDWDCDGDFTSSDLVAAFQYGGYERRREAG